MSIWAGAIQIGVALAQAILAAEAERELAALNGELAKTIIGALSQVIQQSMRQVVEVLQAQRLDELAGRVDGLFTTFIRYAANPNAEGNSERLLRLIDELAQLIGEMNRIMAHIDSDEAAALAVFPAYESAVGLSAMAIAERRYRFNVNEPFAGLFEQAKQNAVRVRDALHRQSDARFSLEARDEEPGFVVIGYSFEGRFRRVALVAAGGDVDAATERVNSVIAARQVREFPHYPAVKETLDLIAELDEVIGR